MTEDQRPNHRPVSLGLKVHATIVLLATAALLILVLYVTLAAIPHVAAWFGYVVIGYLVLCYAVGNGVRYLIDTPRRVKPKQGDTIDKPIMS